MQQRYKIENMVIPIKPMAYKFWEIAPIMRVKWIEMKWKERPQGCGVNNIFTHNIWKSTNCAKGNWNTCIFPERSPLIHSVYRGLYLSSIVTHYLFESIVFKL